MQLEMSFDHSLDPNSPLKKKHEELWIMNKLYDFCFLIFFTYISFFAILVNLNLNSLLIKILFHDQFKGFHLLCILVFQESFYKTHIAFICHHFCFVMVDLLSLPPSLMSSCLRVDITVEFLNIDDEVTLISLSDLLFDVLLLSVFRICVLDCGQFKTFMSFFQALIYIYIGFLFDITF